MSSRVVIDPLSLEPVIELNWFVQSDSTHELPQPTFRRARRLHSGHNGHFYTRPDQAGPNGFDQWNYDCGQWQTEEWVPAILELDEHLVELIFASGSASDDGYEWYLTRNLLYTCSSIFYAHYRKVLFMIESSHIHRFFPTLVIFDTLGLALDEQMEDPRNRHIDEDVEEQRLPVVYHPMSAYQIMNNIGAMDNRARFMRRRADETPDPI